jgi:hypothetical protein
VVLALGAAAVMHFKRKGAQSPSRGKSQEEVDAQHGVSNPAAEKAEGQAGVV